MQAQSTLTIPKLVAALLVAVTNCAVSAAPEDDPLLNEFLKLGSNDSHLATLKLAAAQSKIYFEYRSTALRSEYWRDLKQLAQVILSTRDGAVEITGFASPQLPDTEVADLARRRAASAAARLNALGVSWERMLIVATPGATTHPAPHWRNHRVDFSARRLLHPIEEVAATSTVIKKALPVSAATPTLREKNDSLARLASAATIFYGSSGVYLNDVDRQALAEIARMLSMSTETRTLCLRAFLARGSGSLDEKKALCERRQMAVFDYLVQSGAPADRVNLEIIPAEEVDPGTPNWKLRRVELLVR